jgi:hypothetical protein
MIASRQTHLSFLCILWIILRSLKGTGGLSGCPTVEAFQFRSWASRSRQVTTRLVGKLGESHLSNKEAIASRPFRRNQANFLHDFDKALRVTGVILPGASVILIVERELIRGRSFMIGLLDA